MKTENNLTQRSLPLVCLFFPDPSTPSEAICPVAEMNHMCWFIVFVLPNVELPSKCLHTGMVKCRLVDWDVFVEGGGGGGDWPFPGAVDIEMCVWRGICHSQGQWTANRDKKSLYMKAWWVWWRGQGWVGENHMANASHPFSSTTNFALSPTRWNLIQ